MKVYAVGAYGYGNFGDDYYVDVLKNRMPDLDWTVSENLGEYRPFRYDFTLIAGGGLLYNHVGPCGTSSLRHHFRYPAVAQWFDKKTGMLGTGVQGELTLDAIAPYVPILQAMDICSVRDRASAEFLRSAGVGSVLECADLVYVSGGPPPVRSLRTRPVIGVVASQPGSVLAHPKYEGFEARMRRALELLKGDFDLHFFSFDNRHDTWLPESWPKKCAYTRFDQTVPDPRRSFVRAFQGVDMFLTTRYHGAVLATLNAIPFVGVGAPGQKTARECESFGYPGFISYDASSSQIVDAVRMVWSGRETLGDLLSDAARQKQKLANRSFHLLRIAQTESDCFVPKVIDAMAASAGRTLVLWNADERFWSEAGAVFDRLPAFDCMSPASPALKHPGLDQSITLPPPGLMHWNALGASVQDRILDRYDDVVVCHGLEEGSRRPTNLMGVAARAGKRVWNFALWRHTLNEFQADDLARARDAAGESAPAEALVPRT